MHHLPFYTALLLACFSFGQDGTYPANGALLTQTQVLFQTAETAGAATYLFSIYEEREPDNYELVAEIVDSSQATLIPHLQFGKQYQWSVQAFDPSGNQLTENTLRSFRILSSALVDASQHRFRIAKQDDSSTFNGLLFLDYSRVAIDRTGRPVWFFPDEDHSRRLRDFKLTPSGTLTFLDVHRCEEQLLTGETVWATPSTGTFSGDTTDFYHHEFTRLENGNYMVLAKSIENRTIDFGTTQIHTIPISIIVEYNPRGEVVWQWSSSTYVSDEDLVKIGQKIISGNTLGHMNSFYYDAARERIYAGFRDLSCILEIDKKTGEIIHSYGDKIPSDTTRQAIGFFKKQHAPIVLDSTRMLLFNNNDRGAVSRVQLLSLVTETNPNSEIIWEFSCDFDTQSSGAAARMGNAFPLEKERVMVNMGTVARLFEVTPHKEVVWDCFPEKWNSDSSRWEPQPNYRASYASSLYPYRFSFALRNTSGHPGIRIENEGSESDTYEVRYYTHPKKANKATSVSVTLKRGTATTVDLGTLTDKLPGKKSFYIEVRSLSDSRQKQVRHYPL